MVSVLPEQVERIRWWGAEHGQSVPKKTVYVTYLQSIIQNPLNLHEEEYDGNISLKDFSSIDSSIQSNSPLQARKLFIFNLL